MAEDITVTRRRKLLAHLVASGGTLPLADLHDWSGLKLLAAHQAFSQLMEGLVDDGHVLWDGAIFTITESGRAEAALAPKRGAKRAREAEEGPVASPDDAPPPVEAPPPIEAPASPPDVGPGAGGPPPATPPDVAPATAPLGGSPCPDTALPHVEAPRRGLLLRVARRLGRLLDRTRR